MNVKELVNLIKEVEKREKTRPALEEILFTAIKKNIVTSQEEVETLVDANPDLFKREVCVTLTSSARDKFDQDECEKLPVHKLFDFLEEKMKEEPDLFSGGSLKAKEGDYIIYWRRNKPTAHQSFCDSNPEVVIVGQVRSNYMGKFNIAGITYNSFQPRPELSNTTIDGKEVARFQDKFIDVHVKPGLNFKKQNKLEKLFEEHKIPSVQLLVKNFLNLFNET
ncbi:MAG: hypothetical protein ACTSU5_06510 [Promethearchaeota archaeon]